MDPALAQACANLNAYDVVPGQISEDLLLHRSEAAQMLTAALELINSR